MNTKRRPWLNGVILLTSLAGLVSVAAEKSAQAPTDFYAYYTRLDYQQPQDPALLGQIPVNATRIFAGDQADRADQNPRPAKTGTNPLGQVRRPDRPRRRGNAPGVSAGPPAICRIARRPKGRFPLKPLAECQPDPLCLCSYVRVVEDRPERIVVHWRHVPDPASVVMTEVVHEIFTITPDGKVRREVRVGTPRIEDFNDPSNVTVQELDSNGRRSHRVVAEPGRAFEPNPSRRWPAHPSGRTPARRPALVQVRRRPCGEPGRGARDGEWDALLRRRQQGPLEEGRLRHGVGL